MNSRSATVLDRCRALRTRRPGRIALFALALAVFATQLLLQMHSARHDQLPGAHQVCEQCVTAEHAAPPPATVALLPPSVDGGAPIPVSRAQLPSRPPQSVRSRAPPAFA